MKTRILLVAVLALFSVASFAGGYGQNHRLLNAATELDHSAQAYAKQAHYYSQSRKLNKAARKFSQSTAYFCNLVAQGADIYDLHHAYEKVQSRYHRLHVQASSYQRASYGYSKAPDIYKVKYAFEDVGQIVNRKYNRHASHKNHDGHYENDYGYKNRNYRGYGKTRERTSIRGRIGSRRSGLAFNFDY